MGKNARLNLENLASAPFYMNRFYLEIDKKVLDMDADDFKAFCLQKMEEDLAQFEAIKKEGAWSDRYLQLTPLIIKSNYLRNVLHYDFISSSAYRQKFNIPNTQRELPVNFEIPSETSFFSFIPQDLLTDELSALGDSYENFVNAFSYSRSEEHTSELQSRPHLVCRLLLEKKNNNTTTSPCSCSTY